MAESLLVGRNPAFVSYNLKKSIKTKNLKEMYKKTSYQP